MHDHHGIHINMLYHYWGEPERAPHLSVVDVYVGASRVSGVRTIKYDRQAIQVLYTSERRVCADCER